jgi:hypothetical protein
VSSPRRNHAVFALVSDEELAGLLDACHRTQRTSQHLAGQIIHEWLEEQGHLGAVKPGAGHASLEATAARAIGEGA